MRVGLRPWKLVRCCRVGRGRVDRGRVWRGRIMCLVSRIELRRNAFCKVEDIVEFEYMPVNEKMIIFDALKDSECLLDRKRKESYSPCA